MRHARRHISSLVATLLGAAIWCVATTTTAYALRPDPDQGGGGGSVPPLPPTPETGTSVWQFVLVAGIAMLLTIAVVGLVVSVRHSRSERPSSMLHA